MMNAGFHAIPIDYGANKFSPKVKTLDVDLGSDAGLSLSTELLQHVRPFVVHFGLPCGTCSRAREIPLAKKLKSMGAPEPPPLRSHSHLLGLPGLTGTHAIRVEAANRIYKNAVSLLQTCFHPESSRHVGEPDKIVALGSVGTAGEKLWRPSVHFLVFSPYTTLISMRACMEVIGPNQPGSKFQPLNWIRWQLCAMDDININRGQFQWGLQTGSFRRRLKPNILHCYANALRRFLQSWPQNLHCTTRPNPCD